MDNDQTVHSFDVHSIYNSFAWLRSVKTDDDEQEIDVARKDKKNFLIAW